MAAIVLSRKEGRAGFVVFKLGLTLLGGGVLFWIIFLAANMMPHALTASSIAAIGAAMTMFAVLLGRGRQQK